MGNGKAGGKLGRDTTGAANRVRLDTRSGWLGTTQQQSTSEHRQGMNIRPVQTANARNKVSGTCDGEEDPGPRAARSTTQETAVAAGELPPRCQPRPGEQRGPRPGLGMPPGQCGAPSRLPAQRSRSASKAVCVHVSVCVCLCACVRTAPSRRSPGNPAESLRSSQHGGSRRGSTRPSSLHTPGKLIAAWLQMKFY